MDPLERKTCPMCGQGFHDREALEAATTPAEREVGSIPAEERDRRKELARAFARSQDAEQVCERLIGVWEGELDKVPGDLTLGFVAALEPYAGTILVAILWGEVVPVLP